MSEKTKGTPEGFQNPGGHACAFFHYFLVFKPLLHPSLSEATYGGLKKLNQKG